MPGQARDEFKAYVRRLRHHFEQFNVDTGALCQWFFSLRKWWAASGRNGEAASFGPLGDFLLEPMLEGVEADEKQRDQWRLAVFDDVAGFRSIETLAKRSVPEWLRREMDQARAYWAGEGANLAMQRMFERLGGLQAAHRLVLLKSAAEWIVARYKRGVENWERQHAAWEKERGEWEAAHRKLTPELREQFNRVFRQLRADRPDEPEVRRKNPRICLYERLSKNIDNCSYGQKGHSLKCWKYVEFLKQQAEADKNFNRQLFWETATAFVRLCHKHNVKKASNALQSTHILDALYAEYLKKKQNQKKKKKDKQKSNKSPAQQQNQDIDQAKEKWTENFECNWNAYLKAMELTNSTVLEKGQLPHCQKIGQTHEKSACVFNEHTDLCDRYFRLLGAEFSPRPTDLAELDRLYREWRKRFLAGPRKPSFRYPSSRDLPMPKIFGKDFHEVDFEKSVLRLRLDGMAEGQWVEFGFVPWPRNYSPGRKEVAGLVSSVHTTFVGNRARAGFRFAVAHQRSRCNVMQEQLDELRSRKYPRQRDDQKFVEEARQLLTGSFDGRAEQELRVLAVDMGMNGAYASVYEGKRPEPIAEKALSIIKIKELHEDLPELPKDDEKAEGYDVLGLRKEHVGRHLKVIAEKAPEVMKYRREAGARDPKLTKRDFRELAIHIRWMVRDWARLNVRQIMNVAEEHDCDVIVFESLRGRGMPGYESLDDESQRKKAEQLLYAYGQVRRKVTEKAVERGMRVVTVPYYKSSSFCHACGHEQRNRGRLRKNKGKRLFICECGDRKAEEKANAKCKCSVEVNSDANAARVLARVFWGDVILPEPK